MFTGEAWTVQDEMEHMRQEQLRVKKLRDEAFTVGYELGAVWGMTNGVKALSRVFCGNGGLLGKLSAGTCQKLCGEHGRKHSRH